MDGAPLVEVARQERAEEPRGRKRKEEGSTCWPEEGDEFQGEGSLILKLTHEKSPPSLFAVDPLARGKTKLLKDTVILKSTVGTYTHESVMKKKDASFNKETHAISVTWKSNSTVVVLNAKDDPGTVTTLEKAWREELLRKRGTRLWNALQCELITEEQAANDEVPCRIGMKTAIIYVPDPDENAVSDLVASGWEPKKGTKWVSAWSVTQEGVFQPMYGCWLLAAKNLTMPCDIA